MEIIQHYEDAILTIELSGELDAKSSIDLDETIKLALLQEKTRIVIDCRQLNYISSAGLGVFISHLDDLKAYGGKFVFYGMNGSVYNVFEILGLHTIMEIVRDRFEAQTLMNEG
ncbi:anti sigma b factor antagonist RsbV [soil metagenome]